MYDQCHYPSVASLRRFISPIASLRVSGVLLIAGLAFMSTLQAKAEPREAIPESVLLVALHRLHSTNLAPTVLGVVLDKNVVSQEIQQ